MKKIILCISCALSLSLTACGHDPRQLNKDNVTQAMTSYLATRGDLCLAKSAWPIDVAPQESGTGSRNGVQMPVLERLGLVTGSDEAAEKTDENGMKSTTSVRRYRLTEAGNKFYLTRPGHKYPTGNRYAAARHDFCVAKLSLDSIVGWEPGASAAEAVVTYTYKVAPAPWTSDPDVRKVFPMVDAVIRGAGTLQMKETLVLAGDRWEARDL